MCKSVIYKITFVLWAFKLTLKNEVFYINLKCQKKIEDKVSQS